MYNRYHNQILLLHSCHVLNILLRHIIFQPSLQYHSAKKVVFYGPEGIGKSTFASKFPDPLFIDIVSISICSNLSINTNPQSGFNLRTTAAATLNWYQKKKFAKEQVFYPEAPKDLVSPQELINQQQAILAQNGENQRKRDSLLQPYLYLNLL